MALVKWTTVTSPQRAYSQRYLGHQVTYYVDTDASTPTGTWEITPALNAYQFASGVSTQDLNFYYFTGTHGSPTYWDSDPYYRQRLTVNNTNGALGTQVMWAPVTKSGGDTLSDYYFVGNSLGGTWYYSEYSSLPTVPTAPAQASSCTATRVSDVQASVTWDTTPASDANILRIKRFADGTLSQTFTYDGSANFISTLVDTGVSAGHSYTYSVEYGYYPSAELRDADFILWATPRTSSAIYNTPAAPTAISGARTAASTVRVTLSNTATTSTGLEVEASTDPADWSGAISNTYAGAGLVTADVTGISGIYYFRARNTRGALVSDWSPISDPVVTLTAPNPPTLTAPLAAVHNFTASQTVTFAWQHNPVDGSAQTTAELQYSTDGGGTWTTQTISGTTATYTLTLTGADVGQTFTWRVRTKGADASYSSYSSTKQFLVAQQPSVVITLTDGNNVDVTNGNLSDMPLNYSAAVSGTGTLVGGTFNGETYSEDATVSGANLVGSVTADEVQPENGRTYTITMTASMSTGLTGTGSVTVTMDFADPQAGTLAIGDNDGIVTLTVGLEPIGAGEVAASAIAVQRVTADGTVTIATGLSAGDTITDRYAPLNTAFEYRVMTYSTAGAARAVKYPYTIKSAFWMALWGSDGQAYGRYNPTGGIQVTRPKKARQYFAGRQWPVSYDGINTGETHTVTLLLLTREEREAFAELMRQGGRGVYKSADGYVFRADFDFRYNGAWSTPERDGSVTVTVTRIDGAAL